MIVFVSSYHDAEKPPVPMEVDKCDRCKGMLTKENFGGLGFTGVYCEPCLKARALEREALRFR